MTPPPLAADEIAAQLDEARAQLHRCREALLAERRARDKPPPVFRCLACDGSGYADDPSYTGQAKLSMPCRACHAEWWSANEGRMLRDLRPEDFPPRRKPTQSEVEARATDLAAQLEAAEVKLRAAEEENARFDARHREGRQLLRRFVKYATEDRAETPRTTRLARLTESVADYLSRTAEPSDLLRTEATDGKRTDAINPDGSTGGSGEGVG